MKKILFLTALTAGFLTSCSEDELANMPNNDSTAIAFSTKSFNPAATRSGVTTTSINSFMVTAQNNDKSYFFNQVEFIYNNATSRFESASPFYWPTDGSLSFYAISDPSTNVSTETGTGAPQYTYSDWSGETDLIAATVKSGVKTIPYPLTFRHLTSQIHVSAKAENQTDVLTYKLLGIRMTTPCEGTYSFASTTGETGTWVIDNEKTMQYSYADGIGSGKSFSQTGSVTLPNTYWNILPNKTGNLLFEVEYEIYQAGKRIGDYTGANRKVCSIDAPNLEAGKIYTYNFLLSNTNSSVISFTTELRDWVDNGTDDKYLTDSDGVIEDYSPMNVEAVDLGLPSGLKWASMNVGATKPEERGLYFAWGKTEGYNQNGVGDYEFPQYIAVAGRGDLHLSSDAAHVYWGGNWRMPTYAEFDELKAYCTYSTVTINGVEGMKFTKGKNASLDPDTYIFFPYTGLYEGTLKNTTGGYYWTSSCPEGTYGKYFCFSGSIGMCNGDFWWGMTVRPVCE